jgi:hypothetical protein
MQLLTGAAPTPDSVMFCEARVRAHSAEFAPTIAAFEAEDRKTKLAIAAPSSIRRRTWVSGCFVNFESGVEALGPSSRSKGENDPKVVQV